MMRAEREAGLRPPGVRHCPGRIARVSLETMYGLLAVVLLLFQLQPLVGSAACALFPDRPAEQACDMPEQRPAAPASALQSGSAGQGCALAFVCARSAIAAPSFTAGEQCTTSAALAAAPSAAPTLSGVVSAPPFHPPRA